jgi:hypothetical protein
MLTRFNRRRCSAIAAALLVAVAIQHCAMEAIAGLGDGSGPAWSVATGETAPHPGCENESGCICRGATLVRETRVGDAHVWVALLLAHDFCLSAGYLVLDEEFSPASDFLTPPPLSGRQLRARIASLLI